MYLSKSTYYNYVHIIINYVQKQRKCTCAGLSALPIFFATMAVADGFFQHNYELSEYNY